MREPESGKAAKGHFRQATIDRFAAIIARLQGVAQGVRSATLASPDGLAVASTLGNTEEADRIAAMSGSIAALALAMTHEAGHDAPDRLVLESRTGQIVSMSVPTPSMTLVLTVVTDQTALLGKLLWACRDAVEQMVAADVAVPDEATQ